MPSTHFSLQYHVVFSTKDRAPIIAGPWRERLHAYLGGIVREINGVAEAVGGVADHVHLLLGLRATHCLADVVREIKAFTVGPTQRDAVRQYIAGQEEHHRTRTFQEEYVDFLKRSGIEYDERYLW